jgi:hypothetical protein
MHPDPKSEGLGTGTLILCPLALMTAGASIWYVELSIPALLVSLVGTLATQRGPAHLRRGARWAMAAASLVALVGLGRFAAGKAMTGIVEGGQRATARSAIWRLREVVLAQDGARKTAAIDPDQDGIGSAALIGALAGAHPMRDRTTPGSPLLNYRFRTLVETAIGPAARVGSHLVIVCLPTVDGGWTAMPGVTVDEERAEREFIAYAWPADEVGDVHDVIFVDAHENIRILETTPSPYRGPTMPPPCDAALSPTSPFTPWRDKKPRRSLPGDTSPSPGAVEEETSGN